jgi:RNA polymerase sigma-70 factor (ECF subfamily)
VYWYVRTRTPTDDDAADLTQQIFMRALDALAQFQPRRGSFAAWLFTIARNTLANYHRRQRPTVPWDLIPESLHPASAACPEAEALRREDLARLGALIQTLSADRREVLVLRFVAGLTVGEVAAVTGKREAATRKQLSRTLHALAAQFEGEER